MPTSQQRWRARLLKAMAHPSRIQILESLSEGELCVGDLRQVVGADTSTVSKHLTLMKQVGLVTSRKLGSQVLYRLRLPCILHFFECIQPLVGGQFEDAQPPLRPGGCCNKARLARGVESPALPAQGSIRSGSSK